MKGLWDGGGRGRERKRRIIDLLSVVYDVDMIDEFESSILLSHSQMYPNAVAQPQFRIANGVVGLDALKRQ